MMHPLDESIIELLNASRDDEENLSLPTNDRSFGFHAQQAIEKLLKALIGGHKQKYQYTHDLAELLKDSEAAGEQLPFPAIRIQSLTAYAGIWRYQRPQPVSPEQRADLKQAVIDLRAYTLSRLSILRPDIDWTEFR